MDTTKKPTARAGAPLAAYEEKHSKRPNYKPHPRGGLARSIDGTGRCIGEPIQVRSAEHLTQLLAGTWSGKKGVATCPWCGFSIGQLSETIIGTCCHGGCMTRETDAGLHALGIYIESISRDGGRP